MRRNSFGPSTTCREMFSGSGEPTVPNKTYEGAPADGSGVDNGGIAICTHSVGGAWEQRSQQSAFGQSPTGMLLGSASIGMASASREGFEATPNTRHFATLFNIHANGAVRAQVVADFCVTARRVSLPMGNNPC